MKTKNKRCSNCHFVIDTGSVITGCELSENYKDGVCNAWLRAKRVKTCSACKKKTKDWDWYGPISLKIIRCRECICSDYTPRYNIRQSNSLASAQELPSIDFSVQGLYADIRKSQRKLKVPSMTLGGGIKSRKK